MPEGREERVEVMTEAYEGLENASPGTFDPDTGGPISTSGQEQQEAKVREDLGLPEEPAPAEEPEG